MSAIQEIETTVMALPARERADLAARILSSLPPVLEDDDEGIAEALRRESEAEQYPEVCMTLNQFTSGIAKLRER
ncbi:MAG: Addiction module protein [Verrucomicrobiaceae bacterium]|nr:Addiction module protein [Verrucomicrobiaceae bacterium]